MGEINAAWCAGRKIPINHQRLGRQAIAVWKQTHIPILRASIVYESMKDLLRRPHTAIDRSIWLDRDTRAGMGWRRRKRGSETSHRNRAKVYGVHVLVLVRCGVYVVIAVFTEHFGRFRDALEARRPDLCGAELSRNKKKNHRGTTNIGKPKKRESYDRVVPMSGNTNLSYPRRCCVWLCVVKISCVGRPGLESRKKAPPRTVETGHHHERVAYAHKS